VRTQGKKRGAVREEKKKKRVCSSLTIKTSCVIRSQTDAKRLRGERHGVGEEDRRVLIGEASQGVLLVVETESNKKDLFCGGFMLGWFKRGKNCSIENPAQWAFLKDRKECERRKEHVKLAARKKRGCSGHV